MCCFRKRKRRTKAKDEKKDDAESGAVVGAVPSGEAGLGQTESALKTTTTNSELGSSLVLESGTGPTGTGSAGVQSTKDSKNEGSKGIVISHIPQTKSALEDLPLSTDSLHTIKLPDHSRPVPLNPQEEAEHFDYQRAKAVALGTVLAAGKLEQKVKLTNNELSAKKLNKVKSKKASSRSKKQQKQTPQGKAQVSAPPIHLPQVKQPQLQSAEMSGPPVVVSNPSATLSQQPQSAGVGAIKSEQQVKTQTQRQLKDQSMKNTTGTTTKVLNVQAGREDQSGRAVVQQGNKSTLPPPAMMVGARSAVSGNANFPSIMVDAAASSGYAAAGAQSKSNVLSTKSARSARSMKNSVNNAKSTAGGVVVSPKSQYGGWARSKLDDKSATSEMFAATIESHHEPTARKMN